MSAAGANAEDGTENREVAVPPVLLAFCSHAQKQLSDGNKGVAVRNLAPGFFQGGPIGRVFHADVQTLHELVTLQPQSCTKFERALTPELFHYDGVIVHYLDLHYLQPYWKESPRAHPASLPP